MDIPATIKKLRLRRKMKQSDIKLGKSSSKLSRIENGDQFVRADELIQIIEGLGFSYHEFYHFASMDDYANNFSLKVKRASMNPNDELIKENLIKTYYDDKYKFSNSSRELGCYYAIRNYFSLSWNLPEITDLEANFVYDHLKKQVYFGYYEYILFLNIGTLLDEEKMIELVYIMYPIKDEDLRDQFTKRYALSAMVNSITRLLYSREYEKAMSLIELAQTVDTENTNYYYRLSIQYLKNLVLHFTTEKNEYMRKVLALIELIEDMGDTTIAELLDKEVRQLNSNSGTVLEKDLPKSLVKDH